MTKQVTAQYQAEPTTPKESAQKSVKGHEDEYGHTQRNQNHLIQASLTTVCHILQYHTRIAFPLTIACCLGLVLSCVIDDAKSNMCLFGAMSHRRHAVPHKL